MAKEIEGRKNQSCFDWDEAITYYENSDAIYRKSGDPGLLALAQNGESRVAQLKQYLHQNYPDAVGIGYACNQRGAPAGGIPPSGGTPPPDRCAKFDTAIAQA